MRYADPEPKPTPDEGEGGDAGDGADGSAPEGDD